MNTRTIQGQKVPAILYGTAWKEEATEELVACALRAGFRGFDTANQRKHYYEEGVGRALTRAIASGDVTRDDLFIQTKFTFQRGQDHRLPYDPSARIATQVEQSFRSSLHHLGVSALDSFVLHGPTLRNGLTDADLEAWGAMEAIQRAGGARFLGISNVAPDQLATLLDVAKITPAFVQNRCYASEGWDAAVRTVCKRGSVVYQGFSLLTANRRVLEGNALRAIAAAHGEPPEAIMFRFAMDLGMLPLTGTTRDEHMKVDLHASALILSPEEKRLLEDAR